MITIVILLLFEFHFSLFETQFQAFIHVFENAVVQIEHSEIAFDEFEDEKSNEWEEKNEDHFHV